MAALPKLADVTNWLRPDLQRVAEEYDKRFRVWATSIGAGVPGPTGPAGADGSPGPSGPPGAPGTSASGGLWVGLADLASRKVTAEGAVMLVYDSGAVGTNGFFRGSTSQLLTPDAVNIINDPFSGQWVRLSSF